MAASELTQRWAVAGVGVPVVVVLLYLGGWSLGVLIALFASLGAREVYRLARVKGGDPIALPGALAAGLLVVAATAFPTFSAFAPWALAILGGLTALSLLWALPTRTSEGTPLADVAVTLFGVAYAGLPLACVMLLHALPTEGGWGAAGTVAALGLQVVALPLAATWIGDSVAFFAGTAWGRAKIAPSISPNKSWVGSLAGLAGSGAAAVVWFLLVQGTLIGAPVGNPMVAAALGVALGVAAQVGDFAESLLKREAGVKDSGTIFPGHGGVLDRLDALYLSMPLAYGGLVALEWLS